MGIKLMTTPIDALRSSPLGAEMTPSENGVLAEFVSLRSLADGEVLLPEGACDSLLHVVVRGRIHVVKDGAHGRTLLYTLEPGDLVGELSFMDDAPRYAALLASGPTEVLCLERKDVETLVDREPRVVYKVMRAIMRAAHRVQRKLSLQMRDLEHYIYRTGARD
jgi:CRP/FNR family transcriptional regulator, cyclic AMP receptor protein